MAVSNSITSENAAQAIVKLVAARVLPALVAKLVIGNMVNRDYEATLAQAGDTVNVPIAPVMSSNNIAEGGQVALQNPSLGNAQIVLDTHQESSFHIPDVTKALVVPNLVDAYMDPAVKAVAEKIETDLLSLYASLTANTPVGSYNTAPTESVIDAAETALFKAKVPGPYYLIGSPDFYASLRQIPRFSEYRTAGDAGVMALIQGEVGRLKSFTVFRSQLTPITSGTSTHNVAFARDAFGLVIRRLAPPLPGTGAIAEYLEFGGFGLRIIMSYQPNSLAQQFTIDVLYGADVIRDNFGIEVKS